MIDLLLGSVAYSVLLFAPEIVQGTSTSLAAVRKAGATIDQCHEVATEVRALATKIRAVLEEKDEGT
jgi:hypothetical protein